MITVNTAPSRNELISISTSLVDSCNLQHGIIKWRDGNRNIPSHHLLNWLRFIISTTFVCVCVCARSRQCVLVGWSKTPVQSVFNFPEIKLHGRAITGALDYGKVILEIINRPWSVWMCKCMESACVCVHMHTCVLHTTNNKISHTGAAG